VIRGDPGKELEGVRGRVGEREKPPDAETHFDKPEI
jgi:hypothetical protein